jgi:hypothetical protein
MVLDGATIHHSQETLARFRNYEIVNLTQPAATPEVQASERIWALAKPWFKRQYLKGLRGKTSVNLT